MFERNQPKPEIAAPRQVGRAATAPQARVGAFNALWHELSLGRAPTGALQAKLTISSPADHREREADRVAESIIRMPYQSPGEKAALSAAHEPGRALRQPEEGASNEGDEELISDLPEGMEDDGTVLPKSLPSGPVAAPMDARQFSATEGQQLPPTARQFMEPRFGYDFSSVRVHADLEASRLARSINAAAFAHGRHIYFGAGRFDPDGGGGRRLLAHELTHVVQQGGGDGAAAVGQVYRALLPRPAIHDAGGAATSDIWRTVEAHVNLDQPQKVRIYDSAGSPRDFETSAGTGTRTSSLIPGSPYSIQGKRNPPTSKVGKWGLQYFAWFHGGVGFHSNICYPRPDRARTVLTVDGTPHSHGCMRLHQGDAQAVYNALSVGDAVHIYNRPAGFLGSSWGTP